jgi:hypothetical protein
MEEVRGGWIKLHNDELHNLYSLPDIVERRVRVVSTLLRIREVSGSILGLVILTEGFRDFPESLKLGHDCLFPHPFQFIIHRSIPFIRRYIFSVTGKGYLNKL